MPFTPPNHVGTLMKKHVYPLVQTLENLYNYKEKQVHSQSIVIKIILCLDHDYHSNPIRKRNMQNQINSNGVGNDNFH